MCLYTTVQIETESFIKRLFTTPLFLYRLPFG